jgi:hypothetical protein
MKFSPLPCFLVPLRPKYSPQIKMVVPAHTIFIAMLDHIC